MNVIVCGSREWTRKGPILVRLSKLPKTVLIIQGGARGADTIAREVAHQLRLDVITERAQWKRYGKRAGHVRNEKMLGMNPDLVLAFWDGKSSGTRGMIKIAEKAGVPVEIYEEECP